MLYIYCIIILCILFAVSKAKEQKLLRYTLCYVYGNAASYVLFSTSKFIKQKHNSNHKNVNRNKAKFNNRIDEICRQKRLIQKASYKGEKSHVDVFFQIISRKFINNSPPINHENIVDTEINIVQTLIAPNKEISIICM